MRGDPHSVQFLISVSLLQSSGAAAEELRNWGFDWQLVQRRGRGARRLGSGVDEPGWRWVNAAWRGQGLRRRQRQLEKEHGIHRHADIWICPSAAWHHGCHGGHPAAQLEGQRRCGLQHHHSDFPDAGSVDGLHMVQHRHVQLHT